MALKLQYYGQNDSQWSPDVVLVGDPGVDQQALTSAGYLGGIIVAIATPVNYTAVEAVVVPANGDTSGVNPLGTLLNGPGEFAGAIGPSGSKKTPIVRALFQGNVNSEAYDTGATWTSSLGALLYNGGATAGIGKYTNFARKGANSVAVGICTHVPTAAEPWLGVASLI